MLGCSKLDGLPGDFSFGLGGSAGTFFLGSFLAGFLRLVSYLSLFESDCFSTVLVFSSSFTILRPDFFDVLVVLFFSSLSEGLLMVLAILVFFAVGEDFLLVCFVFGLRRRPGPDFGRFRSNFVVFCVPAYIILMFSWFYGVPGTRKATPPNRQLPMRG